MSKLANSATFQLKLAFADEDLKKPKHDQIMFWLAEWVQVPANMLCILPPLPLYRVSILEHTLEPEAAAALKLKPPYPTFEAEHQRQSKERVDPWDGEPEPILSFNSLDWEHPLKENNRTVAFADMHCRYTVGHTLYRWTIRSHSAERDASSTFPKWTYSPTSNALKFSQHETVADVYFEVKTEITSVGDLMRQLNFYRQTEQLKSHGPYYGAGRHIDPILVVVAPPHKEAEAVCRAHGYGFVEYIP